MTYRSILAARDVTPEILEIAESVYDGWYADSPRIDWVDLLDRIDGAELEDGSCVDLGDNTLSPAIKEIKAHIRRYAKS